MRLCRACSAQCCKGSRELGHGPEWHEPALPALRQAGAPATQLSGLCKGVQDSGLRHAAWSASFFLFEPPVGRHGAPVTPGTATLFAGPGVHLPGVGIPKRAYSIALLCCRGLEPSDAQASERRRCPSQPRGPGRRRGAAAAPRPRQGRGTRQGRGRRPGSWGVLSAKVAGLAEEGADGQQESGGMDGEGGAWPRGRWGRRRRGGADGSSSGSGGGGGYSSDSSSQGMWSSSEELEGEEGGPSSQAVSEGEGGAASAAAPAGMVTRRRRHRQRRQKAPERASRQAGRSLLPRHSSLQPPPPTHSAMPCSRQGAVGRRVAVWWITDEVAGEGRLWEGRITHYNPATGEPAEVHRQKYSCRCCAACSWQEDCRTPLGLGSCCSARACWSQGMSQSARPPDCCAGIPEGVCTRFSPPWAPYTSSQPL
jgi:hypothetical protein